MSQEDVELARAYLDEIALASEYIRGEVGLIAHAASVNAAHSSLSMRQGLDQAA